MIQEEVGSVFLGRRCQFHEAILVCADEQFLPIGDAHLVKNFGQMMANSRLRDAQTVGDITVRQSFSNQVSHFSLPVGQ